jgi:hypothetical protein
MLRFATLLSLAALPLWPQEPETWEALRQRFAKPPAEYSTAPFFVWNGEVTEADIDRFLDDYQAQAIDAFFIHPRPGLITPYLSERWFELIRYAVERARQRGMLAWLYDENSYPSGFAGGHVPAEMPESWRDGHGLALQRLGPGESGDCAILVEQSGRRYCFERVWYPKSPWFAGFSYVDLIRPGVTEKFIELTMRGYERAVGKEFGRTVPGIFTDEPNINPPARGAIRWTPDLLERFERRWGYDLKPHLPALLEPTGDWRRIRHNYYALLLELFIERWSQPWSRYAEQNRLLWTGHYWEHEWPNPRQGPDNMAMYAWHQTPGIDMLFNQFRETVDAQFGNVRSVKELSSVANQLGRRRALSETYGGAGWELRFEDMKRLGDWEYALGVNLMNQHLSFQTIAGARKYDYPQSFSYHTPWWKHYHLLAGYFRRLSLALSSGEQINHILILEPTTSAWMYAGPEPDARMMEIGRDFQAFVTRLEKLQGEYDLGSEDILRRHGRAEKGRLAVGRRRYDLVVLAPGTENLDGSTVQLLEAYLGSGGRVLAFVPPPPRIDGAASDQLERLATRFASAWQRAASLEDPAVRPLLIPEEFQQASGELFHHRRRLRDGELFFFANASLEQRAGALLRLPHRAVSRLDPVSGAIGPFPVRAAAGGVEISVDLPPAGSLLLFAGSQTSPGKPEAPLAERAVSPAGPLRVRRLAPNALRIDYCDLRLGSETYPDLYFYRAADRVFRHFGFEGNPWSTAVQFKSTILDRNRFAPDSGFEAVFHFEIGAGVDRSAIRAVVERPALWQVSVNGHAVSSRPGEWWLDRAFGVYDAGPYLNEGRNDLKLVARPMSVHHELEPVYLLGDFGVAPQARGFRLVPAAALELGSWKQQNLPFYSDAVSYTRTFPITAPGRYKVRLGRWRGAVAEVRVNGAVAGLIGWQPYEVEIPGGLNQGENRVEVIVYGSLKNLLGPHHGKINRGLTGPASFRVAPDEPPPGASYDQEDYGLFDDWQLLVVQP